MYFILQNKFRAVGDGLIIVFNDMVKPKESRDISKRKLEKISFINNNCF